MAEHRVKSWPQFFSAVKSGEKPFELRRADRDYRVADILILQEFDPKCEAYSGSEVRCRITYVLGRDQVCAVSPLALHRDFVILGIRGDQPDSDPPIPNSATPQGA